MQQGLQSEDSIWPGIRVVIPVAEKLCLPDHQEPMSSYHVQGTAGGQLSDHID